MFSVAEEPVVVSGDTCLLFCWQGDALYTKSAVNTALSEWTIFCLPSRDPYPLPNMREFGEFLTSALTFTQSLMEIQVNVNDKQVLKITKTILQSPRPVQTSASSSSTSSSTAAAAASFVWNSLTTSNPKHSAVNLQSPAGLFILPKDANAMLESVVRVTVQYQNDSVARQDARFVSCTANTRIGTDMVKRMQRVTKKSPPKTVTMRSMMLQIMHPISTKKTPQTPGMPATLIQGSKGVMMVVSRVRLDPLPW
jgi:hypothetical protein